VAWENKIQAPAKKKNHQMKYKIKRLGFASQSKGNVREQKREFVGMMGQLGIEVEKARLTTPHSIHRTPPWS